MRSASQAVRWSAVATRSAASYTIRLQGQFEGAETGLCYNRCRYYEDGRFLSRDPVGLCGGQNQFAYPANPTTWVDPRGLSAARSCTPSIDPSVPAPVARQKVYRVYGGEGTVMDPSALVLTRPALPLDGTRGGAPEYIIPNAISSGAVRVDSVSRLDPPL